MAGRWRPHQRDEPAPACPPHNRQVDRDDPNAWTTRLTDRHGVGPTTNNDDEGGEAAGPPNPAVDGEEPDTTTTTPRHRALSAVPGVGAPGRAAPAVGRSWIRFEEWSSQVTSRRSNEPRRR
ncbi:hypothetical protein C731_1784 [Mycolicibacterium hassiacum DSM 44199]|uniref:Uncharacterized protein n=1 Tax=Mycolicibacterium hassiacum (strain DSM 44199 / CIP 105218 / JCM 12690 / 3849) TaxID=1122247 RepID=K5B8S2_MYCHD|nr:hypothetical protein C731_1784 [Mycolicibacterium hassiacum DSM 44199]